MSFLLYLKLLHFIKLILQLHLFVIQMNSYGYNILLLYTIILVNFINTIFIV